ncbi:hypothetical protein GS501_06235 [Saccharibacter sp. 17.LH.SD]|uniref:hypothetical protein n=1 Tax=Saccharibacter sp. 17.LH.SD TaxID=2689393 RepID=UPI00136B7D43|nr:hypothetical protein [Saccharibacter sp. 17.LH.SD]MXV44643.1 hypothetical protein [Saccharibacter sp. 17.LH.SD]
MSVSNETDNKDGPVDLNQAFRDAMGFTLGRARAVSASIDTLRSQAEEEIAFGHINIDENGITSGMRLTIIEPEQEVRAEWRHLKSRFETAMQPYMADITAIDDLRQQVNKIKAKRDQQLKGIELELTQDPRFINVDENYSRSKNRYDDFRNKHSNRDAQMFAKKKIYWVVLALVLLTECFVNYHAFNAFWGVPAVALGTTIILGVLLALAAHQHGELFKQWSYRFAPSKSPGERAGSWRMFALSSAALAIVLCFTGWARWAAALEAMHNQGGGDSILGNVGVVQVNPARDVFISLIANLGAWMVGVIISYVGHDSDPDYMDITKQYHIHRKAWEKMQAVMKARRQHVVATADKEIEEKERAAETRSKAVKPQLNMLRQVAIYQQAIEAEIKAVTDANVATYKDVLLNAVNNGKAKLYLVQGTATRPVSPTDYYRMTVKPAPVA